MAVGLLRWSNEFVKRLWLFALLGVITVQYLGISLPGTSVASVFQFTDSGGWLACSYSFPQGDEWKSNWCMRRPLSFILLSPIAATASWGASVPIFINALISVVAAQQVVNQSRKFELHPLVTFLGAGLLMLVGVFYGLSFGPEGLAFALSCTAVVALIKTFTTHQASWVWPIIGSFAAVCSLLIRPGNPLLTTAVIAICIVYVLSAKNYVAAIVLVSGVGYLSWGLPATLRVLFGLEEAGHGSNFWATVYPLVSAKAEGWPDVYRLFSESSTGFSPDTVAWGALVQKESIEEFLANPIYGINSYVENILWILYSGWLNVAIPILPPSPQWQALSIFSSHATIEPASQVFWSQQEVLSLITLPISLVLWAASWLSLAFAVVWVIRTARSLSGRSEPVRASFGAFFKSLVPGILGTSTVFGLLLLFGLVGHDEQTRHLVQSIPFALFALYPTLFSRGVEDSEILAGKTRTALRSRGLQDLVIASVLVLGVAASTSLQPKPSLLLTGACVGSDSSPSIFTIVGGKSRVADPETTWGSGWVQEAFLELEPGVLLVATGVEPAQIERFYLLTGDKDLIEWPPNNPQQLQVCEVSDGPSALSTLGLRGLRQAEDIPVLADQR